MTRPPELTVATEEGEEDHVPPDVDEDNKMLLAIHTEDGPMIVPGAGNAFTDTTLVA